MSILDLARPHLLGLKPYSSARSLAQEGEIFLDANESPCVLSEDPALAGLNRYPMPQPPALLREAARYYGAAVERILVTRGADEGIDLLIRAFAEPGRDEISITPPTYGVYAIAARLHNCGVREAPLNAAQGFALDAKATLAAALAGPVKIVFICSPNNPTGNGFAPAQIEMLATGLAGRALVIVDEAYIEFSRLTSAASLLKKFPNVVILKTLSKAWGLAGARCGFMLADPQIITLMQTVRAPYPISGSAARAAQAIFNPPGESVMRESAAAVAAERARVAGALALLPAVETVYRSEANFLLVRFVHKEDVWRALRKQGIIVRDRSAELGLDGCLRITIGLKEENDRLLEVLSGRK